MNQTMSELALGQHGGFLVIAFIGLAVASAAVANHLGSRSLTVIPAIFVRLSSALFVGAGLVTLDASALIHIACVACAFVLCGLSMYLLPKLHGAFASRSCHRVSWACFGVMAGSTGLAGETLPLGFAQRVAAGALLFWLLFVAWMPSHPHAYAERNF